MIEAYNITTKELLELWNKWGGENVEYKIEPDDHWYKARPEWTDKSWGSPNSTDRWSIKFHHATESSAVHAPKHYVVTLKSGATIECIDVIESLDLGYHLGNAMKYVWRAGRKDATKKIEDLEKAVAFINRKIGLLRGAS